MALFSEKEYGEKISEKLQAYLLEFTNLEERKQAANAVGLSEYTFRDMLARRTPVTKHTAPAGLELAKIAIHNCTHSINRAGRAKRHLTKRLQ